MGHTPFGYRIENGKAVIDEAAASQVRNLYKNYLSGLSLYQCCEGKPGLTFSMQVPSMMLNRHYLGDDFYPAINDPASFDAVSELSTRSYAARTERPLFAPIIKGTYRLSTW